MDKPNLQPAQRADEIFDVVDASDQVISRATRGEVHARGLWHRATHVLVFNSAGQIFLQKRSLAKDSWPGRWDSSCSGHLDSGEDYRAAASRELAEEIGIVAPPADLDFLLKLSPAQETGWEFVSIFALQSDVRPAINSAEIERGEWFEREFVTREMQRRPDDFTSTLRLHWPRSGQWRKQS
jgi:isopentenyl-diphosphate delta-isomerase type 1